MKASACFHVKSASDGVAVAPPCLSFQPLRDIAAADIGRAVRIDANQAPLLRVRGVRNLEAIREGRLFIYETQTDR